MIHHLLKRHFILALLLVLVRLSATSATQDQQLKVVLRTIGHEFLIELNDSTSLILPVQKAHGRYALSFENEFLYQPEILSLVTKQVLKKNNISESFIVEVEKCDTVGVVHSFKIDLNKRDGIIPCAERLLPKGCYTFYFTVVENENGVTPVVQAQSRSFNFMYAILGILLAGSILLYLIRIRRNRAINPDLINIGQYQFDQKGMVLILKSKTVELSSKESDLLFLLTSNENITLEREHILNVVWGDSGDYVGRTLDVFISKLRKKLEADTTIKIVNIRGVGYRFVVN